METKDTQNTDASVDSLIETALRLKFEQDLPALIEARRNQVKAAITSDVRVKGGSYGHRRASFGRLSEDNSKEVRAMIVSTGANKKNHAALIEKVKERFGFKLRNVTIGKILAEARVQ